MPCIIDTPEINIPTEEGEYNGGWGPINKMTASRAENMTIIQ
jgi:hypothetical protein